LKKEGKMPHARDLDKLKKKIEDAQKNAHPKPFKPGKIQKASSKYFNVGAELVAGVLVGVGCGLLVDWLFGISPWGLISLFILGSLAGMLNVYRALVPPTDKKKK
jgi:ATP synthase protein I